ncbi:hypothetical protein OBBRIDRAFT_740914, partial [Obba rivulosa]
AAMIYDHLCTLTREFELLWDKKFNSVTLIFHLNRWISLAWTMLNIAKPFLSLGTYSVSLFPRDILRIQYPNFLRIVFSAIRMYAVSHGNLALALTVVFLNLVPVGTNVVNTSGSLVLVTISSRTCVVAADILVLVVTWSKTYHIKRAADQAGIRSSIADLLLRDGT